MTVGKPENIQRFDTGVWLAEIAVDVGANLFRLRHRAPGLELLRYPENPAELCEHPQMFGIPVLFPPNRIDGGKFVCGNRQYVFPVNEPERGNHLHGLMLGWPWQLTERRNNSITMTLNYVASVVYPHDFTLTLTYRFTPAAVVQTFCVINRSKLPMPFGLGFHTAFNLPDDGKVTVTAGESYWEMGQPRHLPSGRLLPWRDSGSVFNGHQAVSCHCPVTTEMIDGKPFRGAIIEYQAERTQLRYEIDEQYRHWCLWNDSGGKGFFCIEPMTWMVNAPNLDLPPKITGMQTINPGKTLELQTRISLIRCF